MRGGVDGIELAPGTLTVAPAGVHLGMSAERRLIVGAVNRANEQADELFASAAGVYGARALAVVLTGRLSDGTRGVQAIKAAGGRVIVQDPETAEQRSMPWNALATGCVDLVLEPRGSRTRSSRSSRCPAPPSCSGSAAALGPSRRPPSDGACGSAARAGTGQPVRNQILMALPDDERVAIEQRLEPFRHRVRDSVYRQGERIESVVFPLSGVFSLVVESEDGPPVEIATVGAEGFVGLPVFLQATLTGAHMAFSQVEGEALRMDAADFLDVVNAAPGLRGALQRYAMALMTQVARSAACNRVHSVEQRASRWLLQTHDRVEGDRFTLRREFLAQMLAEDHGAVEA